MKWEGWREIERLWAWARRGIANEEEERRGGAGREAVRAGRGPGNRSLVAGPCSCYLWLAERECPGKGRTPSLLCRERVVSAGWLWTAR